ncbi:MAG TPA: response regulator transcription factor [Rhodanobacteraceae bacterium]
MHPLQPLFLRRALIVEDDSPTRVRLQSLLEVVAGEGARITQVGNVAAAQAALDASSFDIALIDIGLPDGSGVDLIGWMRARHPGIACLVITAMEAEETVLAALRAGAVGYLLKNRDDPELVLALRNIQRGGAPIDPFVARRILTLLAEGSAAPECGASAIEFSEREREILNLVARGRSNRQIAEATGLSRFTIEDYTKAIYRKLAVGSRAEAVFRAQAQGLL